MLEVFLISVDTVFSGRIKKLFPENLKISNKTASNGNEIKRAIRGGCDLIFMDWNHICHLKEIQPNAKVIIAADKYDPRKEYICARMGAKGFITKDMGIASLRKVVKAVNSGQVWMTRAVSTRIFKEYRKIFKT
ncbi:MAG: hypothetical protein AB1610_01245 [Nitrospirota bacterium]